MNKPFLECSIKKCYRIFEIYIAPLEVKRLNGSLSNNTLVWCTKQTKSMEQKVGPTTVASGTNHSC